MDIGHSYASTCVALGSGDVEAFVTKACSENSATGAIDLVFNGGTGPYDVKYFNSSNEIIQPENMNTLFPGNYRVEVTDANCSFATLQVNVGIADPITITATPAPICQASTGSISPEVTGGDGNYTFLWSNGATTKDIFGLSVGAFRVTVTDGGGCTLEKLFSIIKMELNFTITQVPFALCSLDEKASLAVDNISNGEGPFEYHWSNGELTNQITNLASGNYVVTIIDKNGCSNVKEKQIERVIAIRPVGDIGNTQVSHVCNNSNNGAIILQLDGGTNGVTYSWTLNGQFYNKTTRLIQNLGVGTYCVTVSESSGCSAEKCYEIKLIPEITSTVSPNTICPLSGTERNGSIELDVTGGTPPYVYSYDPGPKLVPGLNFIEGLLQGTYEVNVIDANGCSSTKAVTVPGPGELKCYCNSI
jgi:hypothetical protein